MSFIEHDCTVLEHSQALIDVYRTPDNAVADEYPHLGGSVLDVSPRRGLAP
jgi:hypothetical protein